MTGFSGKKQQKAVSQAADIKVCVKSGRMLPEDAQSEKIISDELIPATPAISFETGSD